MKKILIIIYLITFIPLFGQVKYPPVHGAWLTNVDSDVLKSRQNINDAIKFCDSVGINTLFVVVWNKSMTTYPSKILFKMFGEEIDTSLADRDPLKEIIEEGHKKGIKIIAWFEFGFSSSYMLNGGRLLKKEPNWASLDNEGKLVSKNGFEWMNGINSEVQDFMLALISEVVKNYDVDGIQGDDRLPAMPVEAGYDDYTVELYKSEHKGAVPPQNFRDENWIQWRVNKLNEFMRRIYKTVKSLNNNCIVSMSPGIYPWAKEEYLQDWPTWLKEGIVDMICPQIYRNEFRDYKKLLDEIIGSQVRKEDVDKFYPGILLKLGNYYASENYIKDVVKENRRNGVKGEVYFFYEGLKKYPYLFKELYNIK